MHHLLEELQTAARSEGQSEVAFSVESSPNEFFMRRFQICDVRVSSPGYPGILANYVPLYHFLHHEFLLFQGGFGFGPEPYHLVIQTAYNFVLGEIGGGVLKADGRLLDKDSINWAPWQPAIGNDDDALELLGCATAMRRGDGHTVKWTNEGKVVNAIPAVFHAAWRSPERRFAVALANWNTQDRDVPINDERLHAHADLIVLARQPNKTHVRIGESLRLPALSCSLLVGAD